MSTGQRLAVVGLSCRYPDANTPQELWENALAGRRAFRRLPAERMPSEDYWSADPAAPDRHYGTKAAVIKGYEFDRVKYKIGGSTYRATDLTHWLALDVAAEALADAGFVDGEGLPRERTGVIVGNTLTGEFTRANLMRLRWPYVRRTVAAALREEGWDDEQLGTFLQQLEGSYKRPFPPIDEDSLAGGLSNTIAGRICNYFNLNGGGYTVDGACSSSLLSVISACKALIGGELDAAVVGGVDLSIDPFEVIGFAKTGALTNSQMRVYDRDSSGFWPGEGCGMAVLMREEDAIAQQKWIYALISGWGISSDGKGGMTRPEINGYRLALSRAYERAGFGIDTVPYFEGHGTGTAVGDSVELQALSLSRRAADASAPPAAIGTAKALFGHPKAAAGIAGLIKAVMAVHHEVLPPTVGCDNPHPELEGDAPALRALEGAEPWPADQAVRAGVSSMGFGGINAHVVIEAAQPKRSGPMNARNQAIATSAQDSELLLLDARDPEALATRLHALLALVPRLAYAELGDLADELHRGLGGHHLRAAVVASSPEDAEAKLLTLLAAVEAGDERVFDGEDGIFYGQAMRRPRIGYLFPGQGAAAGRVARGLRLRFPEAEQVVASAALDMTDDDTAAATQPRIVAGSMAGLQVLTALGIEADVAVGHSLGELTALHWAGAMDLPAVLRLAALRGHIMSDRSETGGAMASIAAGAAKVEPLISHEPVVIAGYNSPQQTVVSGPEVPVHRTSDRAAAAGLDTAALQVSLAFHSPLVAPSAGEFGDRVAAETLRPLTRRVVSTCTGEELAADTDVAALLREQIVQPVLFMDACAVAAESADLFIEVGPGSVLSRLASANTSVPTVATDTDSRSIGGLLRAVAAAYVLGAEVRHEALVGGRLVRPLDLDGNFGFFTNPCETVPAAPSEAAAPVRVEARVAEPAPRPAAQDAAPTPQEDTPAPATQEAPESAGETTLDLVIRLCAERAELPVGSVHPDSRFLDDLHMSSITVGQIANQAATELGAAMPAGSTNYATATIADLAAALDNLDATPSADGGMVAGAGPWVRPFTTEMVETVCPAPAGATGPGSWRLHAPDGHPIGEALRTALQEAGVGSGVLLCLAPDVDDTGIGLALAAAQDALADPVDRFVTVHHGRGLTGLAKTLHLESPGVHTTVVDVAAEDSSVPLVVADVAATDGFSEVRHDEDGVRRTPVLTLWQAPAPDPQDALGEHDVLLVTGGGKGIMAECALALAGDSGARLAVMGRGDPDDDAALAANLERFTAAGLTYRYLQCDVTDVDCVRTAIATIGEEFGPVTAILHGAGRNEPNPISALDEDEFRRTMAPKIDGLRAVLDAVGSDALRLLITFGSIIGRAGLSGEAHYATANEWLAEMTGRMAAEHPSCRSVCLEWSVWSGAGMGERLDVIETLLRDGITAIAVEEGIDVLRTIVAAKETPPVLVITGRAGGLDTIRYEQRELPLFRFVDQVLVHYPGVELVTESDLSPGSDPYLSNHQLGSDLLVPAVIGLEAMAQVACAVTGRESIPLIEDVEFMRPIVVPPDGTNTIRVAATVNPDGNSVVVAIRSADTGYATDHFRARMRYDAAEPEHGTAPEPTGLPPVPLDPARDLYGGLLFQGALFQRLVRYHRIAALGCEAEIAPDPSASWFSGYLPARLLLGDPGLRDSLMHGIQVCVPDATLLPAAVQSIWIAPARGETGPEVLTLHAVERQHDGDSYIYDVEVRGDGVVVERWEGLRLQAVRKLDGAGPWVPPLLGPYLQRQLIDLIGFDGAVAVEPYDEETDRQESTALTVGRALGGVTKVTYGSDGQPEVEGTNVSASHGSGATLAVATDSRVGCDIEPVVDRDRAEWAKLLGANLDVADLVARDGGGETAASAATRLWAAIESLQKAGQPHLDALTPVGSGPDRWIVFSAGDWRVATFVTAIQGAQDQVGVAVAIASKAG